MREAYHRDLDILREQLFTMSTLATTAILTATQALLEADLELAELTISGDDRLDELGRRCEEHAYAILAREAPVAGELRAVVTAIKIGEKLERMGDLARHVAELARRRHPFPVLPEPLARRFAEIGRLASDAGGRLQHTLARPTGDHAPVIETADDALDRCCAEALTHVGRARPEYPTQVGVDVALLARFYERFGDQAVTITKQLDYAVTGDHPDRPRRDPTPTTTPTSTPADETFTDDTSDIPDPSATLDTSDSSGTV